MQFGVSTIFGRANTAIHGEPGFYMRRLARPTDEYPSRSIMCSPCARALFNDIADAEDFLEHPGDIGRLARTYIDEVAH